jgi:ammonium transporter, Amt family
MLWFGWFGFNGGSALAANGSAAMAIVATQVSASAAAVTWMVIEWVRGKPSVLGLATGAVAGLAAVTPASGFVGPIGALAIGTASGAVCWLAVARLKQRFGYDDSLDVFGVHGVGGVLGTMLAAVFAAPAFGGNQATLDVGHQLGVQLIAVSAVAIYTAAASFVILRVVALLVPLRVDEEHEALGVDLVHHGETGYNL